MGRRHQLSASYELNYARNLRNLWDIPPQRLNIYCQPFQLPEGYIKVSSQASCLGPDWIGMERYLSVIEETIPFRILKTKEKASLIWKYLRGPLGAVDESVVVLIDYLNTSTEIF